MRALGNTRVVCRKTERVAESAAADKGKNGSYGRDLKQVSGINKKLGFKY